jgi:hypothetical protein
MEVGMTDDQARADIALIRAAVDQGRAYALARSPDMIVWGLLVGAGYLGTWAIVTGHASIRPGLLWIVVLAIGWLFYVLRRLPGRESPAPRRPLVVALRMLWLGIGICLTLTAVVGILSGGMGLDWFGPFAVGVMGAGFFASAPLCDLPWLRWVSAAWWLGELGSFWLHGTVLVLPFSAALYVLLLAGPGLVLRLRPRAA